MSTLVIKSKSKKNIELLFQLAKRMGEKPVIESETLRGFDKSLKSVKAIMSGKIKPRRLEDLLND